MGLPESLHSQEYFDQLRDARDRALEESNWLGRRKKIGKFTLGSAYAMWRTESGGSAMLSDEGVRFGRTTLTKLKPTTMRIFESLAGNFELTEFSMDLDDIGAIDVHRTICSNPSFAAVARFELAKFKVRRYELDYPTDDDRVRLFEEMERGATGLYV